MQRTPFWPTSPPKPLNPWFLTGCYLLEARKRQGFDSDRRWSFPTRLSWVLTQRGRDLQPHEAILDQHCRSAMDEVLARTMVRSDLHDETKQDGETQRLERPFPESRFGSLIFCGFVKAPNKSFNWVLCMGDGPLSNQCLSGQTHFLNIATALLEVETLNRFAGFHQVDIFRSADALKPSCIAISIASPFNMRLSFHLSISL